MKLGMVFRCEILGFGFVYIHNTLHSARTVEWASGKRKANCCENVMLWTQNYFVMFCLVGWLQSVLFSRCHSLGRSYTLIHPHSIDTIRCPGESELYTRRAYVHRTQRISQSFGNKLNRSFAIQSLIRNDSTVSSYRFTSIELSEFSFLRGPIALGGEFRFSFFPSKSSNLNFSFVFSSPNWHEWKLFHTNGHSTSMCINSCTRFVQPQHVRREHEHNMITRVRKLINNKQTQSCSPLILILSFSVRRIFRLDCSVAMGRLWFSSEIY